MKHEKPYRMILIGIVIAIILVLIIIRVKSRYQYPDTAAAAKTQATIQSAVLTSAGTSNSPGVVTITTTAAHGYTAGDVILYGTPKVAYIVLSTPAPTSTTFAINASASTGFTASSVFTPAYKTLMDALEQCNIDNQNTPNQATFDSCITTKTSDYVTSMCPWTTNIPTAASASAAIVAAKASFDTDINTIRTAYNALQNSVSTDLTPILNAGRRADITGATRKYLTAVCPNYYVPATGGPVPASYSTWQASSTAIATNPPAVYFNGSLLSFTDATSKAAVKSRLIAWAKYAAATTAGTSPLVPSCTLYSTGTGPNWKLAQQYGPGTVTASVTLPWNTPESTCTAPSTWTLS